MEFFEKTLESKTVYSGKMFTVKKNKVALPNNKTTLRELISIKKNANATCIIAITKSKKILLVKQFRYAINRNLWEIPAGKSEPNETPLNCAKRELLEETGFKSNHWIKLGKLTPCPGYCNKIMHIFLAKNVFKLCAPNPDPDEFVKTGLFKFNQIAHKAASGWLTDSKSVCAILKTQFLIMKNKINI